MKLARYDQALQFLDKALELDPNHLQAWYNKAIALQEMGDRQAAKECFNRAKK